VTTINGATLQVTWGRGYGWAEVGGLALNLQILDPTLLQAPTSVQVQVFNLDPSAEITFDIDGTEVYTATADSTGFLGQTSIPVAEALGDAGTHTLTATSAGRTPDSQNFTIKREPNLALHALGPDAEPVAISGTIGPNGERHFVLQDLMPDGLGSWVMDPSPTSWNPPYVHKATNVEHTTAGSGRYEITESLLGPMDFTLAGYCPDETFYNHLLDYDGLKRRFYLIDHRNRAWIVAFTGTELKPRKRQQDQDGTFTDWAHDYTIHAVVFNQRWKVPQ